MNSNLKYYLVAEYQDKSDLKFLSFSNKKCFSLEELKNIFSAFSSFE